MHLLALILINNNKMRFLEYSCNERVIEEIRSKEISLITLIK